MNVGTEIQNVIILSKFHPLFFVFSFFLWISQRAASSSWDRCERFGFGDFRA
jgi:hypothetical protein